VFDATRERMHEPCQGLGSAANNLQNRIWRANEVENGGSSGIRIRRHGLTCAVSPGRVVSSAVSLAEGSPAKHLPSVSTRLQTTICR
jgi:hypothetical protein